MPGLATLSSCSEAALASQGVAEFAFKSNKSRDQNSQGAGVILRSRSSASSRCSVTLAGAEAWEDGWAVAAGLHWDGVEWVMQKRFVCVYTYICLLKYL